MTRVLSAFFAGALFGALVIVMQTSEKISELKLTNEDVVRKNKECKASVDIQNEKISELVEYSEKKSKEYTELLSRPESIRYKIEYREVKSNECSDIKKILDDIRSGGF